MNETVLISARPAERWDHGFPIGGGSFGAMLLGGADTERIYLNEETIWSGEEMQAPDPDFREKLQKLRAMYLAGDEYIDEEAARLLGDSMQRVRSYETAGELEITLPDTGELRHYRRELRLRSGLFRAVFQKGDLLVRESAYCSYPYEVTVVRYRFSRPVTVQAAYLRQFLTGAEFADGILRCTARTACGDHRFAVCIKPVTDGTVRFEYGGLVIENAEKITFLVSIATAFAYGDGFAEEALGILAEADDPEELRRCSEEDHRALFDRTALSFAEPDESLAALPVETRLERLKNDPAATDPGLYELYFNFGKYLLICSSRRGTFPANLQGVWAEKIENPWNADYHTNINLQMNYWPAEPLDLGECHEALFDYMNEVLLPSGRETARALYGCRGTVVHHLSDLYGYTGPADGLWGLWPLGAGWLSTHMWEHYLFTLNEDFLRETAYAFMKESALFFLDYMFESANGTLLSGPSMSPENEFFIDTPAGRKKGYLCFSPTMDVEIISAVLRNYVAAEEILKIDPETAAAAVRALEKMPPLRVASNGTLCEWLCEREEPEPGHRHISHAFALYPGCAVTADTPALFEAMRKTLERRLANGGGHTGWSRAWLICLYARLGQGEEAYAHLRALLTNSTLPSLLDTHPPFQIDGNFGGTAGVAETLLQSHGGVIRLLPAVPAGLSGSFSGLKARGNVSVGATFENGRVKTFSLASPTPQRVKVQVPGAAKLLCGAAEYLPENGVFTLPAGEEPGTFTCVGQ